MVELSANRFGVYTLGIAAMLIAAAALMIVGPQAMQWFTQQIGVEPIFVLSWNWLRWPAALLLSSLAVAMVYHFQSLLSPPP